MEKNIGIPWIKLNCDSMINYLTEGFYPVKYSDKAQIFPPVQGKNYVYVVASGQVIVYLSNFDGKEKVLLIAEKNCILGECSAIFNLPIAVNLRAKNKLSLYIIPAHIFKERLNNNKEYMWDIIKLSNEKLRALREQVGMLAFDSPEMRVRKALFWLFKLHGSERSEGILLCRKLTHQNIADLTGLSRVSVSYIFTRLYKKGILKKINGDLYLNDFWNLV